MKKFYISLLSLGFLNPILAQNRTMKLLWSDKSGALGAYASFDKSPDTLVTPVRPGCPDSIYIYMFQGQYSGYVSGTNSFMDKEKGQAFTAPYPAKVTDVVVPAAVVTGNGSYTAKVYAVSNDTVIGSLLGQSAPTNLQTPNVYFFPITNPPSVASGNKFLVAITVLANAGDTIALPTSKFGCGARESFEKWSDDNWYVVETVYGDDFDFIMGAVIMDNTSIQNLEEFATVAYPTPAADMVVISAGIHIAGQYTLHVYNNAGVLVQSMNLGLLTPGPFVYSLNLENLASGLYTYRMVSNEAISSGKIIKL
ncbi:MAG: T9SS type A sorting domain-containing protein [Flavobacteriales bacterium]|nr:T9SS type A sorting domain-containing protein [Flavobacteriales bacterium]